MPLPSDFFTIKEIMERWNKSLPYIIDCIGVKLREHPAQGFCMVEDGLPVRNGRNILITPDNYGGLVWVDTIFRKLRTSGNLEGCPLRVSCGDLYAYEEKHGIGPEFADDDTDSSALLSGSPTRELKAAVAAHKYFYVGNNMKSGSQNTQIEKWLKANYHGLKSPARARIATMINHSRHKQK